MRAYVDAIDEQIQLTHGKDLHIWKCLKFASYIVMQNTTRYVNAREFMSEYEY